MSNIELLQETNPLRIKLSRVATSNEPNAALIRPGDSISVGDVREQARAERDKLRGLLEDLAAARTRSWSPSAVLIEQRDAALARAEQAERERDALRRLDRRDRSASNELIDRIRNFIKSFRPDLFGAEQTKEGQSK